MDASFSLPIVLWLAKQWHCYWFILVPANTPGYPSFLIVGVGHVTGSHPETLWQMKASLKHGLSLCQTPTWNIQARLLGPSFMILAETHINNMAGVIIAEWMCLWNRWANTLSLIIIIYEDPSTNADYEHHTVNEVFYPFLPVFHRILLQVEDATHSMWWHLIWVAPQTCSLYLTKCALIAT